MFNKYAFLICSIFAFSIFADELDLPKLPQQYQDVIVNNEVVSKGIRECEKRYEILQKFLDQYKRPITVLDIGASEGYFSLRIAHDYDSVCVMVEGGYNDKWQTGKKLKKICELNTDLDNIILLDKRLSSADVSAIAECEHFDVVLLFNVVHHMSDYKKMIQNVQRLGDNIIVEMPCDVGKSVHDYFVNTYNPQFLGSFSRHTSGGKGEMFLLKGKNNGITKSSMPMQLPINHKIISDFDKKYYVKFGKQFEWEPGINLATFKMMNGVYPTPEVIAKAIKESPIEKQNDPMMWNMILQGEKVVWIDQYDPNITRPWFYAEDALNYCINSLTLTAAEFNKYCKKRPPTIKY